MSRLSGSFSFSFFSLAAAFSSARRARSFLVSASWKRTEFIAASAAALLSSAALCAAHAREEDQREGGRERERERDRRVREQAATTAQLRGLVAW